MKMKAAKEQWNEEQYKNIEKGVMSGQEGLLHPQGFHQDLAAEVSSHRRQQ